MRFGARQISFALVDLAESLVNAGQIEGVAAGTVDIRFRDIALPMRYHRVRKVRDVICAAQIVVETMRTVGSGSVGKRIRRPEFADGLDGLFLGKTTLWH